MSVGFAALAAFQRVHAAPPPPTGTKWPALYGVWNAPTDFPSVAYAAQLDKILLHGGAGVINQAGPLLAANPNIKLALYNFMQGVYTGGSGNDPWHADFMAQLAVNEGLVLHNPDGNANPRVLRDPGNNIMVIDPRVSAGNDFGGCTAVKLMQGGYSQGTGQSWDTQGKIKILFTDGAWGGSTIATGANGSPWGVQPTPAQQAAWEGANPYSIVPPTGNIGTSSAWTVTWLQTVRAALQTAGFELEANSIVAGKFNNTTWFDDSLSHIPNTICTMDENFLTSGGPGLGDVRNFPWQLQRMLNSMNQSKDWVGMVGTGGGLTTAIWVFAISGILQYSNGTNAYICYPNAGFNQTYLTIAQTIRNKIIGPNTNDGHNGLSFSPDGSGFLLRRNFLRVGGGSNVVALMNIDPNGQARTDLSLNVTVPASTGWIDGTTS